MVKAGEGGSKRETDGPQRVAGHDRQGSHDGEVVSLRGWGAEGERVGESERERDVEMAGEVKRRR